MNFSEAYASVFSIHAEVYATQMIFAWEMEEGIAARDLMSAATGMHGNWAPTNQSDVYYIALWILTMKPDF